MKRLFRLFVILAAFSIVAASCGDSDESGTTTAAATGESSDEMTDDGGEMTDDGGEMTDDAGGGGDGMAAAQAAVDVLKEIPTEIGVTEPLTSVPDAKTFAWLQCELPSCAQIGVGIEKATELLGWEYLKIDVGSFASADGHQQAIDAGADFIAHSGSPAATFQEQLDASNAAGIPFLSCYSADPVGGADNGIYMQCGDADSTRKAGERIANWMIVDSEGTANVLMVNIRDFPVLVAEEEGAAATFEANCPDCTFEVLNVSLDQFAGGEVPAAVASQLQSNSDINYVHFSFADIPGGVAETLDESGLLDQVTLVGVDYNAARLQEIVDGTHAAWTTNPKEYAGLLMVDAAARLSVGMELTEERAASDLPTFIVDDGDLAASLIPTDGWIGPDGMYDQFAALWGVE